MFSFCNRGNLHNLFDNSLLILKVKELRGIRSPAGYREETVPSFSLVAPTAIYILLGIIPWLENRALKMARSSHFYFLLDKAASIQWLLDGVRIQVHAECSCQATVISPPMSMSPTRGPTPYSLYLREETRISPMIFHFLQANHHVL